MMNKTPNKQRFRPSIPVESTLKEPTYNSKRPQHSLFNFMQEIISQLEQLGKHRTSESYLSALSSYRRFRNGEDIHLEKISSEEMQRYESFLAQQGLCPNSTSYYMRILRAVYNRAVELGLIEQRYPFKHVYTGIGKTMKRAISIDYLKQIKQLDLSRKPTMALSRDLFLFSFYTRGMAFVDIAYLRKQNIQGNVISYRRHKTGQPLYVKIEKCTREIIERFNDKVRLIDMKCLNYIVLIVIMNLLAICVSGQSVKVVYEYGGLNEITQYRDGGRSECFYGPCPCCFGTKACQSCRGVKICAICGGKGGIITAGYGNFIPCYYCSSTGRCPQCEGTGECLCMKVSKYPGYSPRYAKFYDKNGRLTKTDYYTPGPSPGSSRRSSGSSSSGACSRCKGTGVDPTPNSGGSLQSWVAYYNREGNQCPYCGRLSSHYHDRCARCNVPRN